MNARTRIEERYDELVARAEAAGDAPILSPPGLHLPGYHDESEPNPQPMTATINGEVFTYRKAAALMRQWRKEGVDRTVEDLEHAVELLVEVPLRRAVLARPAVGEWWSWALDSKAGKIAWLVAVTLPRIGFAEQVLDSFPSQADAAKVLAWVRERFLDEFEPELSGILQRVADEHGRFLCVVIDRGGWVRHWRDGALAVLHLAEERVRQSGSHPVVRISANREAHESLRILSAGGRSGPESPWASATTAEDWVELVWDGRPRPVQLRIAFDKSSPIDGAILRGLLDELQEDGVRDWILFWRMAGEQGATGHFRWTWREHRERTSYARRLASKKASESELAASVVKRIWRMKNAELRHHRALDDNTVGFVRVGPFGLIDIPAGVEEIGKAGRSLVAAKMQINPAIYAGAHRAAKSPNFTLIPERALELPSRALRLLAFLVYQWHYDRNPEGTTLRAGTLWEYASIRAGLRTQRKRWPAAKQALDRDLDLLVSEIGITVTADEIVNPEALYRIRAPNWWIDRIIHGVPPHYGPSVASVPRTGRELKGWREAQGMSQAQIAAAIGVDQKTISRAEQAPLVPLRPRLLTALATVRGKAA
ncbi:helix-turn-helix domain-containing protein [Vulgatibacter sp.]|uniref:helix-turn-helix domain-containing protein n=1 Tax=Vulgatibacter sp. TaxID=1971226 RepID=UPI00356AB54F